MRASPRKLVPSTPRYPFFNHVPVNLSVMGVLNEKVIGGLHFIIHREGHALRFSRGSSCTISGQLLLDTVDPTVFDDLHFVHLSLQVGSWKAVHFAQSLSPVPPSKILARTKSIPAAFSAWTVSNGGFSMDFTIDIPQSYFRESEPSEDAKKSANRVIAVELSAEIRVNRVEAEKSFDMAWRQRDKTIWVWSVEKEPRFSIPFSFCSLF